MSKLNELKSWIFRWTTLSKKADLSFILAQAQPNASLSEKVQWLEQLLGWIRSSTDLPHEFDTRTGQLHSVRIRFVLQVLERNPEWKRNVATTICSVMIESSGVSLFAQTGLSQETGFIGEAVNRISNKILPVVDSESDLSHVFARIFTAYSDVTWVKNISPEVSKQFIDMLKSNADMADKAAKSLAEDMIDAIMLLTARIESLGLTAEIRQRTQEKRVVASPFFRLNDEVRRIDDQASILKTLNDCRQAVRNAFVHLEESGVSVTLVFRLDTISTSLIRLQTLLQMVGKIPQAPEGQTTAAFLGDLIRESIRRNSVKALVSKHTRLMARKVVERTGASGEHYIARDRREWTQMLTSAVGGGLLTGFTTIFKFLVVSMGAPLFFEGMFFWINYSGSFLLMQFMGFSLATKQPSATAPALAGKLKDPDDQKETEQFVDEVLRIIRSQFAAALGNFTAVIPATVALTLGYKALFNNDIIDIKDAHHIVASFHPFKTLTLLHGAITGVILWVSSLAGGWFENWIVFHRIPEVLAQSHSLRTIFGEKRCKNFSKWFLHNCSGFGVNLSLGFFLAFTPVFAKFFGIPIEAKHFTLSTGYLAAAVTILPGSQLDYVAIAYAVFGILMVGLLNFGVSFALAMAVAMRARQVNNSWRQKLAAAIRQRFFKNPFGFFFAPVVSGAETVAIAKEPGNDRLAK